MGKPRKKLDITNPRSFKDGVGAAFERLKKLTLDGADTTSVDSRLTYGQAHSMVVDTLGMEPLDFVCMLLSMSMVANSRVVMSPIDSARLAIMVHDRLYPMPDSKSRTKTAEQSQFELEFAWQDNGQVVQLEAAE